MSQFLNAGAFLPVYFLTKDSSGYFNFIISISALGMGGSVVLPSLIQADFVAHEQRKNTDVPIQGLITGIWLVAKKFAQGIGSGVGFMILAFSGFNPQAAAPTSDLALCVLGLLYCVVPSLLCLISILFIKKYQFVE